MAELRRKLLARQFSGSVVDTVLAELRQHGLQSDRRFTESFVHARVQRGYGPLRIQAELRERGIGAGLIDEFVDVEAPQWRDRAAAARRKRFGANRPGDYDERARQARFLQYRGFTAEQIRGALKPGGAEPD